MGAGAGKEGEPVVAPVPAATPPAQASGGSTQQQQDSNTTPQKSPRLVVAASTAAGKDDEDQVVSPTTRAMAVVPKMTMEELLGEPGSSAKYFKMNAIGKGAFGEAFIVKRASDGKSFVAKLMDLRAMSQKDKRYAQTEILCLAHSNHFAIVHYIEHCVMDEDTVVIVMEYADHGDLYNNIRKGHLQLSEREAGLYFVQLLLALDHIHRRRMIHRDIKSANVFMTSKGLLKLGDFGFSQQYDQTVSNPIATTFLGTPYYLAPEMWKGNRYGKKADMWAVGIVLFELLTSKRPFIAQNMKELKEKVVEGGYAMPDSISREMQDVVRRILVLDPAHRLSAQDALRTPIMQHYLVLLEKHVQETDFDEETKALVRANINEAQQSIQQALADEEAQGNAVYHEGTVYKESDGGWKERYLILGDGCLTLTLAKGKEAAGKTDRSKKIDLNSILSAVAVSAAEGGSTTKFVFAISTTYSSAILMACKTESERDKWVTKLLGALEMN